MKKTLSVWMLLVRSTFLKLLALLAALAAAQGVLLVQGRSALARQQDALPEGFEHAPPNLETVFDASHIPLACALALILLVLHLSLPGWQRGAKPAYTLARLRIDRRQLYFCHVLHSAVCLTLFWAVNALTLLGLLAWAGPRWFGDACGPQALMLAVYRTPLLHSLLPLADWALLLRNLAAVTLLAVTLGRTVLARSKTVRWGLILLTGVVLVFFPQAVTLTDRWLLLVQLSVLLVFAAGTVYTVLEREVRDEL